MSSNPAEHRYSIRWLIVILTAVLIIIFFPYLFGGKTFLPSAFFDTMTLPGMAHYGPPQDQNHYFLDGIAQTFPYKVETKEALTKGKLAYWNPHILGGYPQYAESLANNFDIFNALLLFLEPNEALIFQSLIELLIAGIGMLLLLRFFGVSPIINLIFSFAYMLNSMFISTLANRWILASFCWMPFIILHLLRYFAFGRKEYLLYLSLFLALSFLGGTLQTSFFAVLILTIITLTYPDKYTKGRFVDRLMILFFTVVLSFALSALMWLPTLELFFQTLFQGGILYASHINSDYGFFDRILTLPLMVSLFFPTITGNATAYNVKRIAHIDPMNFNGAIGFFPLLIGIWGCIVLWKRKDIRPFIIVAILGLIVPIFTPLYNFVYHRFFILSSFSFCIIGAVGFQSYSDDLKLRQSFKKILTKVTLALSIIVALLLMIQVYILYNFNSLLTFCTKYTLTRSPDSAFAGNQTWMVDRVVKTLHYFASFSSELWIPLLSSCIIVIAFFSFYKQKIRFGSLALIILIGTIIELSVFVKSWLPSTELQRFPIYPASMINTYLNQDSSESHFIVWRDPLTEYKMLTRNGSNIYKTYDIDGYETLTNRSMISFYYRNYRLDSLDLRLLGLANVKYIIAGKLMPKTLDLRRVFAADSLTIYENLLCKPRAYFASQAMRVESDSSVMKELLKVTFDGSIALFSKDDAPPDTIPPLEKNNMIRFDGSEDEEVAMTVHSDSKAILILTDTYYPGWKCYVNGIQKPIYRANYCMRAILIGPGTSTVIFRFEPDIFTAGLGISAIATLASIMGIIYLKKGKLAKK